MVRYTRTFIAACLGVPGLPATPLRLPGGDDGSYCPVEPLSLQENLETGTFCSTPFFYSGAAMGKSPQGSGTI